MCRPNKTGQRTKTFYALVVVLQSSKQAVAKVTHGYAIEKKRTDHTHTTGTAASPRSSFLLFYFILVYLRAEAVWRTSAPAEGSQRTESFSPGEHCYSTRAPGGVVI